MDPEATADQFADTRLITPVMRPDMERWFDVALVSDGSPSLEIWRETISELYRLLLRHGAFRDVRRWKLLSEASGVLLVSESGLKQHGRALIDPTSRRLILGCVNK
jgi:hypothetical protein